MDSDLSSGELAAPLFETIDLLLSEVHSPYLKDGYDWGMITQDGKEGFLMVLQSLREHIQEAVSGIQGGTQLCSVNPEVLNDPRAAMYNKMALDENVFSYIESVRFSRLHCDRKILHCCKAGERERTLLESACRKSVHYCL